MLRADVAVEHGIVVRVFMVAFCLTILVFLYAICILSA
jgi:hypothetical protein